MIEKESINTSELILNRVCDTQPAQSHFITEPYAFSWVFIDIGASVPRGSTKFS